MKSADGSVTDLHQLELFDCNEYRLPRGVASVPASPKRGGKPRKDRPRVERFIQGCFDFGSEDESGVLEV